MFHLGKRFAAWVLKVWCLFVCREIVMYSDIRVSVLLCSIVQTFLYCFRMRHLVWNNTGRKVRKIYEKQVWINYVDTFFFFFSPRKSNSNVVTRSDVLHSYDVSCSFSLDWHCSKASSVFTDNNGTVFRTS